MKRLPFVKKKKAKRKVTKNGKGKKRYNYFVIWYKIKKNLSGAEFRRTKKKKIFKSAGGDNVGKVVLNYDNDLSIPSFFIY